MKKPIITAFLILIVFSVILYAYCLSLGTFTSYSNLATQTPTPELRKEWTSIENILDQKKNDVIISTDLLLKNLAKQEDDITTYLDQKASTQMGNISIVVAIILAALGFFIKDAGHYLSGKQRSIFLILCALIIVTFIFSIYCSYKGFVIRDNFATYNITDFFKIMGDKNSDIKTLQISNILENYQIYTTNIVLNQNKAGALFLSAKFFTVGVIGFALVSLWAMIVVTMGNRKRG